jgi:hypothetical protein
VKWRALGTLQKSIRLERNSDGGTPTGVYWELGDGSGFGRGRQSGLVRVPVAFQGPGGLDDAESDRGSPLLDDV